MEDPEDGPIKFINPSASSSAEDTEMIGLGPEDSENIDPNVQAEKEPLLSMEIWTCAYCDEKNRSYQYFCSTCMSLKPEGSNSKSVHKSQVRKRTLSDKEQPPVKKSNVTSMTSSIQDVIDLEEVNSSTSVENPAKSGSTGRQGKNLCSSLNAILKNISTLNLQLTNLKF